MEEKLSLYVGVSKNSNGGEKCWQARAWKSGKYHWIGNFGSEQDAHDAVVNFKKKPDLTEIRLQENSLDPILPSQHFTQSRPSPRLNKELLLRLAILEQVLRDLGSPNEQIRTQASDWVRGITKSPKTFSFKDICDLCEADEKRAKKSLLSLCVSSRS